MQPTQLPVCACDSLGILWPRIKEAHPPCQQGLVPCGRSARPVQIKPQPNRRSTPRLDVSTPPLPHTTSTSSSAPQTPRATSSSVPPPPSHPFQPQPFLGLPIPHQAARPHPPRCTLQAQTGWLHPSLRPTCSCHHRGWQRGACLLRVQSGQGQGRWGHHTRVRHAEQAGSQQWAARPLMELTLENLI